ncbi:hypothetical protein ACQR3V_16015 [Rhodococcus erythropolis]|uniref:hypothetical protein n=1 Tax=Rhodococcus erythropolis TaxID=1833 RepID=UPI003D0A85FE
MKSLDAAPAQVAMRKFLRVGVVVEGAADDAYQTDGMIGLVCGACSYNTGGRFSGGTGANLIPIHLAR